MNGGKKFKLLFVFKFLQTNKMAAAVAKAPEKTKSLKTCRYEVPEAFAGDAARKSPQLTFSTMGAGSL